MRKPVIIAGLILLCVFVILQFFQPDRNPGIQLNEENDLVIITGMPDSLAVIFTNSCYDCHSGRTNYPWYSYISPISWYLSSHIEKGKEQLDFNNFGSLEKSQRIGALADICEEIESDLMPLKSYLLIHRSARIGEDEKEAICIWSEAEALKIMRE